MLSGPFTRLLAQHEESVSHLYRCFAAAIPDAKDFWDKMANEELSHKEMIASIDEKMQEHTWQFARPKFTVGAIAGACERLVTKAELVAKNGISMRAAMDFALETERGMLESGFFEIIQSDDSEMMSVLESLSSYTYAHLKELEHESKRLKWKVKGGKVTKNFECNVLTGGNLRDNIKAVQGNMIGNLVALEEAAAALYRTYASRLDEHAPFWSKIAAEEMQHAAVLRKLYDVLERGNVFYNVSRFSGDEIHGEIDLLLNLEYSARFEVLSHHKALNEALKIERLLVESKFYKAVSSDAPEFRFLAERMVKQSQEHVRRLEDEVGRAIDMGELAAKPVKPLGDDEITFDSPQQ